MPSLKPEQLLHAIQSGQIGNFYIFDGPETWLKERALDSLLLKCLPPEARDLNFDRFHGEDCGGGDVALAARSLPFLAEKRVVLVQAAHRFSAHDARLVADSLPEIPASTILVFFYDGKANVRDEIPAHVSSRGSIVTFWAPFPNQMPAWVIQEARRRGKNMDLQVARVLSEAGGDLQEISNELDKLVLFV